MKRILMIGLMLSLIVLSGCASNSDYNIKCLEIAKNEKGISTDACSYGHIFGGQGNKMCYCNEYIFTNNSKEFVRQVDFIIR